MLGWASYIKIKDSERDKLDVKERKCTLIWYGLDDIGYRFWDNQNKRVIRSQNVVFNEIAISKDVFVTSLKIKKKPKRKRSS